MSFNQLVVGSNPTRPTIFSWFVSGWILGSDATSVIQIENASSEVFFSIIGVWRSPVARLLWEQDVRSSNPLTPTIFAQLYQG
ncbi:hypothetical protein ALQ06_200019 [Pseudomonas syringae pv. berberidis]|nr:hypothetical protein ALQ06_200019 [Pseudomonas syringae pv. berberidis]